MTSGRLQQIALVYIPAIVLAALVIPFLTFWTRLPEPIATHWSDAPNGSMPKLGAVSLLVGLWLFFAIRAAWPTIKHTHSDDGADALSYGRPPLTTLYFIAGVFLVAQSAIVWANLDAPHWATAKALPTLPFVAAVLGASLLFAGIGRILENRLSDAHATATSTSAPLDLDFSERALWWGHATNPWLLALTMGISTWLFLTMPPGSNAPVRYAVPIITAVVGLLFSSIHVVVGGHNVAIELGLWRWPRKIIPLGDINAVEVQHVHPLRHGGWGYRSCGAGCRAFIIRGGDALALKQAGGRTTMVTVNDAREGAGLLETLINRHRSDAQQAPPTAVEDA